MQFVKQKSSTQKLIQKLAAMLPVAFPILFVFVAILAPILEYLRIPNSVSAYKSIHFLCHQLPTRSFFVFTSPMGLCSRCFGIYLGLFSVAIATCKYRSYRPNLYYAIMLVAPCIVDGVSQALGMRFSTNSLRFSTGLLAGIGIGLLLYPWWFSAIENFDNKKHRYLVYAASIVMFLYMIFGSVSFILAAKSEAVLMDGTPVILILDETLQSDQVSQGALVALHVAQDICIDGLCVIKSNSPAIAKVSISKGNDIVGQEGRIVISFESVQAYDGRSINLRTLLDVHGENRETIAVAAGYIVCPLFGFVKGTQAGLPAGISLKAFTSGDYKFLKH